MTTRASPCITPTEPSRERQTVFATARKTPRSTTSGGRAEPGILGRTLWPEIRNNTLAPTSSITVCQRAHTLPAERCPQSPGRRSLTAQPHSPSRADPKKTVATGTRCNFDGDCLALQSHRSLGWPSQPLRCGLLGTSLTLRVTASADCRTSRYTRWPFWSAAFYPRVDT
jgi:hypothetical protein